jgi:hypothetical protein
MVPWHVAGRRSLTIDGPDESLGQRWWGDLRVPSLMEQRSARILWNGAGPA